MTKPTTAQHAAITAFEVTTSAEVEYPDRRAVKDTATWTVTPDDLAAGRYLLETVEGAASRIARHRHLDRLEATHRRGTIWVETRSVTALEVAS